MLPPRAPAAWLPLALLLAGCAAAPEAPSSPLLASYTGEDCTEAGIALAGDRAAAQALLPEGFAPRDAGVALGPAAAGSALVVVAVNRCAFTVGDAWATEPELFVWIEAVPPHALALPQADTQVVEVADWRPAGPLLDALSAVRPGAAAATIGGVSDKGFTAGGAFAATVRPASGGEVVLEGVAATQQHVLQHGDAPCCRTFAESSDGLLLTDIVATDQPQVSATCTLRATAAPLAALIGEAEVEGTCAVNLGYGFTALVTRADG